MIRHDSSFAIEPYARYWYSSDTSACLLPCSMKMISTISYVVAVVLWSLSQVAHSGGIPIQLLICSNPTSSMPVISAIDWGLWLDIASMI